MSALANELLSKEERSKIVDYLESFIKNGAEVIEYCKAGLCDNMFTILEIDDGLYEYIERLTGSAYPISGEGDYCDCDLDKYSGEQLALRKALAQKIIDDIKGE